MFCETRINLINWIVGSEEKVLEVECVVRKVGIGKIIVNSLGSVVIVGSGPQIGRSCVLEEDIGGEGIGNIAIEDSELVA
jgi:hypothetical protein